MINWGLGGFFFSKVFKKMHGFPEFVQQVFHGYPDQHGKNYGVFSIATFEYWRVNNVSMKYVEIEVHDMHHTAGVLPWDYSLMSD
jgi:heme oxygenase